MIWPVSSTNSSTEMIPSDLYPTSTMTSDGVTLSDRPLHDLTFRDIAEAGIVKVQKARVFLWIYLIVQRGETR